MDIETALRATSILKRIPSTVFGNLDYPNDDPPKQSLGYESQCFVELWRAILGQRLGWLGLGSRLGQYTEV